MRLKTLENIVERQNHYRIPPFQTIIPQQTHHMPLQSTASLHLCTAADPAFLAIDVPPCNQPFYAPATANPLPKKLKNIPLNRQPPAGLVGVNTLIQENKLLLTFVHLQALRPRSLPERQPLVQK